jgi:hypothetical protein
MPFRGAYNCSKFALEGLTDTLRLELHGSGVWVSLIEPGPIDIALPRERARQVPRVHRCGLQRAPRQLPGHGGKAGERWPGGNRSRCRPRRCCKRVVHALESPRPRARYAVTVPTYLFAFLRRLLSTRQLDCLAAPARLAVVAGDSAQAVWAKYSARKRSKGICGSASRRACSASDSAAHPVELRYRLVGKRALE